MRPSNRVGAAASPRRTRRRLLAVTGALFASAAVIGVVAAGYMADEVPGPGSSAQRATDGTVGQHALTSGGPVVKLASWNGGGTMDLSQPGKPTVVLAMAGWCPTCIAPARDLKAVHEEFGDRVNVIAVSVDPGETEETLSRFREAADDPAYLWAFDSDGAFASTFALRYLDTVIVLDSAGNQLHQSVRPSTDELREILVSALGDAR